MQKQIGHRLPGHVISEPGIYSGRAAFGVTAVALLAAVHLSHGTVPSARGGDRIGHSRRPTQSPTRTSTPPTSSMRVTGPTIVPCECSGGRPRHLPRRRPDSRNRQRRRCQPTYSFEDAAPAPSSEATPMSNDQLTAWYWGQVSDFELPLLTAGPFRYATRASTYLAAARPLTANRNRPSRLRRSA